MNNIIKITLDTNCVINLLDFSSNTSTSVEELSEIIRYGLSNKIEISITTRVESDLLENRDEQKKEKMLKALNMFPVVGSVFRLDESFLDGKDVLVSNKEKIITEELQKIIFPGLSKNSGSYINSIRDIDHLTGHIINTGDIFVTDDKKILNKQETLKKSYGLIVMSPVNCLNYLKSVIKSNEKVIITSPDDRYRSKAFVGQVAFDYSNNNGKFIIGDGYFLFETKWSKASKDRIHAYNDAPSIHSIALARGENNIIDIQDVDLFDYSSRCRTVKSGEIIIFKNINNNIAFIKVISIKDDSRGDDADELTFEYLIKIDDTKS